MTVDMGCDGVGSIESTSYTTTFPGFTGHFQGKRSDPVATGAVVVDGSTTDPEIETLEDTNISHT